MRLTKNYLYINIMCEEKQKWYDLFVWFEL